MRQRQRPVMQQQEVKAVHQLAEFTADIFADAKDLSDPADPFHNVDNLEQSDEKVAEENKNFFTARFVEKDGLVGLSDLPDESDEIMSDYLMMRMKGLEVKPPQYVDLDTSRNYVDFIKNSIVNANLSENEFSGSANESLIDRLQSSFANVQTGRIEE